MILDHLGDLNWLAIVVATIAWFAFSAIWYSVPPLSNAWQKAAKVSGLEGPPLVTLLVPTFIGYFVTTIVIALIARGRGGHGAGGWTGAGRSARSGFWSYRSPGRADLRQEGRVVRLDQWRQRHHRLCDCWDDRLGVGLNERGDQGGSPLVV